MYTIPSKITFLQKKYWRWEILRDVIYCLYIFRTLLRRVYPCQFQVYCINLLKFTEQGEALMDIWSLKIPNGFQYSLNFGTEFRKWLVQNFSNEFFEFLLWVLEDLILPEKKNIFVIEWTLGKWNVAFLPLKYFQKEILIIYAKEVYFYL